MKKTIYISAIIALISSISLVAQDFQGKAYYISKSKINIDFGGRQISEAQKARIKERQKKLSTNNYVLEFDKGSSLFSEIVSINQNTRPIGSRGGARMAMFMGQNEGTYYKNVVTKEFVGQRDIYGKQFLIKDSLQNYEWQLSDEVKTIGKYTCFKATATVPALSNISKDHKETTTTVTAWYTIEIPVSHGPLMFWGLPGLILELKTENKVFLCSKIELAAEGEIAIKIPKKGKKINQEEFDKIFAEKAKEVREQFRRGRSGGFKRN